jgi:hypothetical protein
MDGFDSSVLGGALDLLFISAFDFLCVHQFMILAALYLTSVKSPGTVLHEIQGGLSTVRYSTAILEYYLGCGSDHKCTFGRSYLKNWIFTDCRIMPYATLLRLLDKVSVHAIGGEGQNMHYCSHHPDPLRIRVSRPFRPSYQRKVY